MVRRNRNLNDLQFVGPEVEHGLRELGVDPASASFREEEVDITPFGPTELDDIEDDEDYERVSSFMDTPASEYPPIVVGKREGQDVLLDGYARMNAAHSQGVSRLRAYRQI